MDKIVEISKSGVVQSINNGKKSSNKKEKNQPNTILVEIENGQVTEITGIPYGFRVLVRDFDLDGLEDHQLIVDEDGWQCHETVYPKSNKI